MSYTAPQIIPELVKTTVARLARWVRDELEKISTAVTALENVTEDLIYGDVRDYGAIGDGVTDDTAAISAAALDVLDVVIPAGFTFLVTSSITGLRSGHHFTGGGTIKTPDPYNFHVFDLTGLSDVVIEDIKATSGGLAVGYASAQARFVNMDGSTRCKVMRCRTTGFQSAVRLFNSTDCLVDGNSFISPHGWGVNIQSLARRNRVTNNLISGAINEHGIYLSASSGNTAIENIVAHNIVLNCAINGIKVATYSHDNIIAQNVVRGSTNAIYVTDNANENQVIGNRCQGNTTWGIQVFTTCTDNLISGNYLIGNSTGGIDINTANTNSVVGNVCKSNGLGIRTNSNNTLISDNTLTSETTGVTISGTNNVLGVNKFNSCGTDVTDSGTNTDMSAYADVALESGIRVDFQDSQGTVGAAGGASALPAQPTGYIPVKVAGSTFVVPYYTAS